MTPSPLLEGPPPSMPMPIQPRDASVSGGTGNPVLDEISAAHASLSPQAQQAIEGAHGALGISPSHSDPAIAASAAPSSPELAVPGVSGPRGPLPILSPEIPAPASPMAGATGGTPMATGQLTTAKPESALMQERSRLTAAPLPSSDPLAHTRADTGRPGYQQIHNPWLRGLATAGDVIASGVFPRFGQFIPGTTGYRNNLLAGTEGAIEDEQGSAKSAADVAKTETETGLLPGQHAAQEALQNAEARNYISEAEARKNPDNQQITHPVIDPDDPTKTPRAAWFDKKTNTVKYGPAIGAAPVAAKAPTNEIEATLQAPENKGKPVADVTYAGNGVHTELRMERTRPKISPENGRIP